MQWKKYSILCNKEISNSFTFIWLKGIEYAIFVRSTNEPNCWELIILPTFNHSPQCYVCQMLCLYISHWHKTFHRSRYISKKKYVLWNVVFLPLPHLAQDSHVTGRELTMQLRRYYVMLKVWCHGKIVIGCQRR